MGGKLEPSAPPSVFFPLLPWDVQRLRGWCVWTFLVARIGWSMVLQPGVVLADQASKSITTCR